MASSLKNYFFTSIFVGIISMLTILICEFKDSLICNDTFVYRALVFLRLREEHRLCIRQASVNRMLGCFDMIIQAIGSLWHSTIDRTATIPALPFGRILSAAILPMGKAMGLTMINLTLWIGHLIMTSLRAVAWKAFSGVWTMVAWKATSASIVAVSTAVLAWFKFKGRSLRVPPGIEPSATENAFEARPPPQPVIRSLKVWVKYPQATRLSTNQLIQMLAPIGGTFFWLNKKGQLPDDLLRFSVARTKKLYFFGSRTVSDHEDALAVWKKNDLALWVKGYGTVVPTVHSQNKNGEDAIEIIKEFTQLLEAVSLEDTKDLCFNVAMVYPSDEETEVAEQMVNNIDELEAKFREVLEENQA